MTAKEVYSSSARFAVSLAVFAMIWIVWFTISDRIDREAPITGRSYILPYIHIGLCAILSIAAAFFHCKIWLLRAIWFIPYATGMIATMLLALFVEQELWGYSDCKTIVGLLLGIPILVLAIVFASLAALVSARIVKNRKAGAPL
jgi:hypothetical protein